jgi:hypothetical protein
VVVTSNITPSVNPPCFGHGVAGKTEFVGKMIKGPCSCNRFRQKAVEISNRFREALGLLLIKFGNHLGLNNGEVRILLFISAQAPNFFDGFLSSLSLT